MQCVRSRLPGQSGFTLVELIISIVIVGLLAIGSTNFIGRSTQGLADTAERSQLATVGWVVSEKISREVREALPNSFRINASNTCLEYIPTEAGTDYLSVPTVVAGTTISIVPFSSYTIDAARDRIAVYPNTVGGLYDLSANGAISSVVSASAPGSVTNSIDLTLTSGHRFLSDSPTRRLFVVKTPVMYCFSGSELRRFSAYGYQASMPGMGSLGSGVVMANRLQNGRFEYSPGTLTRAGIVTLSFAVAGSRHDSNQAVQAITQEVQIRNVP